MKISEHIKSLIDASESKDFEKAMLFVCLAVDGTSVKMYPDVKGVGRRIRKFIQDYMDIIELMFGGINLKETNFPFVNNKGNIGVKFEDIIYEKFRCNLAHGKELPSGYGLNSKISEGIHQIQIDIEKQFIIFPESVIYALALPCVLSPANFDQRIGNTNYYFKDPINQYVVDRWWGKVDCARSIMDFENCIKVKMDFSNVWPTK
jgi:hypothetical protein